MRRIVLQEYRTSRDILLTIQQREGLRQVCRGIRIEPSSWSVDHYDLTPDQRVGLVALPGLVVEIRPKIPLISVLFLVSYASDAVAWIGRSQPDFGPDAEFTDVLAVMLARLVERATHRGLLHGYRVEEEALQAPRGRIRFDEQLRRRLGIMPPVEVRHDDFTPDILENRLLAAASSVMLRLPLRSAAARKELIRAQQLFGGVSRTHFPATAVPDVLFTRLNRHYEAAVLLASLILRSVSLDIGSGSARASGLLVDMNVVFEQFVRRALREALGINARAFPDRPPRIRLDRDGTVPLRPDLCLITDQRVVWAGDAKYKRLPAGAYMNADLYQLLAYAVALDLPGCMLIYAADEGVSNAEYVVRHAGKRLSVVALDLAAPRSAILQQVGSLAKRIAGEARTPTHAI